MVRSTESVRLPAVAGRFYPRDPQELRATVEGLLEEAHPTPLPGRLKLKALVVPHAGLPYSGPVSAMGYALLLLKGAPLYRTVLLLGPAHTARFPGAAALDVEAWRTPLGLVDTSPAVAQAVRRGAFPSLEAAHRLEHCLEVQLPFLQVVLGNFEIFPLLTGEVEPAELAERLLPWARGADLLIASSDLSHFRPYEEAKRIDAVANAAIPALQVERVAQEVEACGKEAILTLLHLARRWGWQGRLVDYRNSGDTAGERAQVVGYGCYAFYEP